MICHWDEVASRRAEAGHIAGEWTDLGKAAGTKTVGLNRIRIDPGKWSTPFHRETGEEEIFYVLAGSGICLLDASAFAVRPGDCVVHRMREARTLRAGDDGLDVLALGTRGGTQVGHLPRAGVGWIGLPTRAGSVVSRPASTAIAHGIRAGAPGLTYLAYGTRNPNDLCYYPRSNKSYFRRLGLVARLEDLDYDDGEPS